MLIERDSKPSFGDDSELLCSIWVGTFSGIGDILLASPDIWIKETDLKEHIYPEIWERHIVKVYTIRTKEFVFWIRIVSR